MKKITSLVAGIVIILGTSSVCFANENIKETDIKNSSWVQVGTYKGNSLYLNLEDSLKNIEKVNPDIKIRDKKIEILKEQYDYDKSKSVCPDDDDANSVAYKRQELLDWKISENNLDNEKHDREDKLKALKNDFKRQYLNIIEDEKLLETTNKQIDNLNKRIEKAKLENSLGKINKIEVDKLIAQSSELQTKLNNIKLQIDSQMLTIKQTLSIDLNKDVKLDEIKEEYKKFDENGINYRLDNALERNYSLQRQENEISLLKSEKGIYMSAEGTMKNDIRRLDINIAEQRERINQAKVSTKINIMKAYYDLKNKEDMVENQKLNLDIAQENFNIMSNKFNAGIINKIDEESAKIALDEQKVNYQKSINDYMVTCESFKNLLEEK